jgi:hypothetical protein
MILKCQTCDKWYKDIEAFYKEHYLDESWSGDYEFHLLNGPYLPVHKLENEQALMRQFAQNMFGEGPKWSGVF